ncbi:fibronectin type III domain-containing protein [Acerihabitans arboris]|uniref:Fibronectin type-III domain-containing protein n=1 Tax=Acerihabitans arboris TaxID=2691583 RepID=A0A845SIL9_9GAMM|nr:fibronectin type III domain-containing protein [Acerihabitans arboris]NDL63212.1 hypothetical protein [Acerihabitans arboris]
MTQKFNQDNSFPISLLDPPTDFSATIITDTSVVLVWQFPLIPPYQFFWNIRVTDPESTPIYVTEINHISASIEHLQPNTSYTFYISTVSLQGEESAQSSLTVTTLASLYYYPPFPDGYPSQSPHHPHYPGSE